MDRLAVEGGSLAVHDLSAGSASPDDPVVVLVHGITANGLCWTRVARELAERADPVRLLAPDLRGRGGSRDVTVPDGIRAHADDLARLVESTGGPAVLVGHSMGGFVTALAAATRPHLVSAAVLVDGGLALPLPDGLTADQSIDAVVGPAMTRLRMTFTSPEDYLKFWEAHPAVGPLLAGPAGADVRAYLLHDLVSRDGGYRSSCNEQVVRADGRDLMVDPEVSSAASRACAQQVPAHLIWAARNLMNQEPGLYDAKRLGELGLPDALTTEGVDTDHYDVLFSDEGVEAIVSAVVDRLHNS